MAIFLLKKFLLNLLLWKNGISIKIVQTKEDLVHARGLAWKIYALQEHYIDPEFFPKKILEDEFDGHAIYFLAFHRKEAIGTVRLILPSEFGFPIEKLYNFKNIPIKKSRAAEISRLAVLEDYKGKGVSLNLCKSCFEESVLRGIDYWYALLPETLKNHFKKYGIKFIQLQSEKLTPQQEKNREPHRFYFEQKKPKPYLIFLKGLPEDFKL